MVRGRNEAGDGGLGKRTGYVGSSSVYKRKIPVFGTHGRRRPVVPPNYLVKEPVSSRKLSYLWLGIGGTHTAHPLLRRNVAVTDPP